MIIDPKTGKPFPPAARGAQTALTTQLHGRYDDHPYRGLTPAKLGALFDSAEQGDISAQAELFTDLEERDGHLRAEMGKRRMRVSELDWDLKPPRQANTLEKENTEVVKALLQQLDMYTLLYDLTDGIGKGIANCELSWAYIDGYQTVQTATWRPLSWFQIARVGADQQVRLRDGSPGGQALWQYGWVTHTARSISASLERIALYRACAWPSLIRGFTIGDWCEFLEPYGHPTKIGKYDASASPEDRETLLRAVREIGRRSGGIISAQTQIDLLASVQGDPQVFERLIAWADRTQSKIILGSTLTSQADGKTSTNALGEIHSGETVMIRDHDAKALANTITRQLVWPTALINGLFARGRCPVFEFDTRKSEDLESFARALPALVELGLPVGADWAGERLRIPKPDDNETLLAIRAPAEANPAPEKRQEAPLSGAGVGKDSAPTPKTPLMPFNTRLTNGLIAAVQPDFAKNPADVLVNQLEEAAQPAMDAMLNRLRALSESAPDLITLRDLVLAAFSDSDTEQLGAVMETAFALSALRGAFDVAKGK